MTNVAGERSTVILSWDDIDKTVAGLAERVCADGLPDVLVGVVRGGLVPAVWLSHRIGMRPMRVGWMPLRSTWQGTSTTASSGKFSISPRLGTLP